MLAWVLCLWCAVGCSRAESIFIRNVTIIDGRSPAPRAGMSVAIEGSRISAVASSDSLSSASGATILDGDGLYLVPGLWDMHTHALWEPFVGDGHLGLFVRNGVTGIRDMGGSIEALEAARASEHPTPRIVASGPWLNLVAIDPRAGRSVEDPAEARRTVQELAAAGVDFIKVYTQVSRETFLAILEEAAAAGLPVAGHVPQGVSAREASDLGLRSIEHMQAETGGYCTNDDACQELFEAFRRNHTWQTPTLVILRNRAFLQSSRVFDDPAMAFAPAYLLAEWETTRLGRAGQDDEARQERFGREVELARSVHRAGLPLLIGSDAGDLYSLAGFSLHDELALLVEAGLTEWETLRAATLGAAEFLELTDTLGTVEVGKLADLVLLGASPLEDIRNTTNIQNVILDGRVVQPETMVR